MQQIYVCSPLAGDIEGNLKRAARYAEYVFRRGCFPIVPHLYFSMFLDDTNEKDRKLGMSVGLEMVEKCDAMWIFGDVISEGMRVEINRAQFRDKRLQFVSDKEVDGVLEQGWGG